MPNSTPSSAACGNSRPPDRMATGAPARIAWRPSRWLAWSMPVLGLLAACSLLASDLPATFAWPAAIAALGYAAWLFRRERGRPSLELVLAPGAAPLVDGVAVADFQLQWRGPLAFATWRDAAGRRQYRAWWPDTLPPALRRELRLATPAPPDAGGRASMAP
jgi:toxin CptA